MKGNKGLAPSKRRLVNDFAVTSNQWQRNPKQEKFLEYYFDPKSNSFGNVYKSAIMAGYKDSYARTLTRSKNKNMWISEYVSKTMLSPEHITQGITEIATSPHEQAKDRLNALKLLAELQGLLVKKSITGHINIEQAINDLK